MIIERERRVNNFIFRLLVRLFLIDSNMDIMDSQILDGAPPNGYIDPPIAFDVPIPLRTQELTSLRNLAPMVRAEYRYRNHGSSLVVITLKLAV
jgi:hypothetical protein